MKPDIKLFGIFGDPVRHTLSPHMHGAAFEERGINGLYVPFLVKPSDLAKAVASIRTLNMEGVNVTSPHKEAIREFLDDLDVSVKQTGAVNTIHNKNGKLIGYNTDTTGFSTSLHEDAHFDPKGKKVVILGAGGAARAIAAALCRDGAKKIIIVNRDKNRAVLLARHIRKIFEKDPMALGMEETRALYWHIREANLLVNATSVGRRGTEMPSIPLPAIHAGLTVYDVIYQDTPLILESKKLGARVCNGIGMLVHQGARSFEIWTGKKAPVKAMRQAVEKALKNR